MFMVCFHGKDPTQGASHGCQNKTDSSHSLGDGLAGTVPNAVIRLGHPATIHTMSWPVLRLTLTASLSRRWPHRPATYVAPPLRRYVKVGAGGGETVKPPPPGTLQLSVSKLPRRPRYDSLILA